ncbi:MAG: zf-TFIIB domain-containing protein [Myxococcota bacterium]
MTKPSSTEEEFFAREELEKKRKLAAEQSAKLSQQQREEAKKLHFMKCPKCGSDLHEVAYKDAQIDKCFSCGGVYLDSGELEHLVGKEGGYVQSVIKFFAK